MLRARSVSTRLSVGRQIDRVSSKRDFSRPWDGVRLTRVRTRTYVCVCVCEPTTRCFARGKTNLGHAGRRPIAAYRKRIIDGRECAWKTAKNVRRCDERASESRRDISEGPFLPPSPRAFRNRTRPPFVVSETNVAQRSPAVHHPGATTVGDLYTRVRDVRRLIVFPDTNIAWQKWRMARVLSVKYHRTGRNRFSSRFNYPNALCTIVAEISLNGANETVVLCPYGLFVHGLTGFLLRSWPTRSW